MKFMAILPSKVLVRATSKVSQTYDSNISVTPIIMSGLPNRSYFATQTFE